jgi:hypothetical protein
MRVRIGPYKDCFGPYQLAELIMFWVPKEPDEFGIPRTADRVHNFGEWLAHGSVEPEPEVGEIRGWDRDRPTTWLYRFLLWIDSFRTRRVDIHIDRWDTWSMDHTLAEIVLPMLKQLRATKHGSPHVDDDDVPEHLRSTAAPPRENEWDIDEFHHDRWEWVISEMIFAFDSKVNDSWQEQFHSGNTDWQSRRREDGLYEMVDGPAHTAKWDQEGHQAYQVRISNGFRLFGKYFEGLWD